jgi:CHAD domain-containing protein
MSFELHHRKRVNKELKSLTRRQLGRAGRLLADSNASTFKTAVHESRKSVKKVRAILNVFEQSGAEIPRKDEQRLKRAGRELSALRDAAAIVETFDRVRRRYPTSLSEHTYGILRRGLVRAGVQQERRARRDGVAAHAARQLDKTRKAAKRWTAPAFDLPELFFVIAASYRRSRKAMKRASESGRSAAIHAWRKELKLFWHQLRLVQPLTAGIAPLVGELKRLETELGEDHNLVVLGATLRGCRDLRSMHADVAQVAQLAARMRPPLRRRAFALGRRLHRRKPGAFGRWLRRSSRQKRQHHAAA